MQYVLTTTKENSTNVPKAILIPLVLDCIAHRVRFEDLQIARLRQGSERAVVCKEIFVNENAAFDQHSREAGSLCFPVFAPPQLLRVRGWVHPELGASGGERKVFVSSAQHSSPV